MDATSLAPLFSIIVAVLIAGVLVWAIRALPGIDPTFQQVAFVLIVACLIVYAILVLAGLTRDVFVLPKRS